MNGVDFGYCGPAPDPETLWQRWNLDPVLIAVLLVAGIAGALALRHAGYNRQAALGAGIGGLAILFVSPLCALGVALASARIGHHIALTAIVAPLLALAMPASWRLRLAGFAMPALILHTVAFWVWHHPLAYGEALVSVPAYWLMQVTLLGSAVALWGAALAARLPMAIGLLLATAMQMGFLAAILVFAQNPIYAGHLATTDVFGLSPLTDQQFGGLLMWVPASLPYLALALMRLAGALKPSGEASA
jgi:putative membrane protein